MLYKCVCMYSCTAGGPCYINVYVCIHAQQVSPCYINVYVCMYSCTAGGPCYINVYVCRVSYRILSLGGETRAL